MKQNNNNNNDYKKNEAPKVRTHNITISSQKNKQSVSYFNEASK